MYRLLIILTLLISCGSEKRTKPLPPNCIPPVGIALFDTLPKTVYNFSGGRNIALWQRYKQTEAFPGEIAYSGCLLTECGSGNIIMQWGQHTHRALEMSPDTLIVKHLAFMAMSPNLDMIYMPWLTTKVFYNNDKTDTISYFNQEVHYSAGDINRCFARLDTNKWSTHHELGNGKQAARMMRFASQMMIASISGSKKAEFYFHLFKEKFMPEGDYAIRYKEMETIIAYYHNHPQQRK